MYVKRHVVTVTASATSGVTTYSTDIAEGRVLTVRLTTSLTYGSSANIVITGEQSGVSVLTKLVGSSAGTWKPRAAVVSTTGGAVAHTTASGITLAREPVILANERIKFVLSNAGAATTGTFHVYVG